jgi:Holliday junction resolvase RusA-like endonuclease
MEEIRLTVLGNPKAQARHRHFTRGTFSGSYDPSQQAKETFASILQSQAPKEPICDPISLELLFYMSRPKNHYGTGKKAEFLKDNAPEYHAGRPDIDNLQKFVQDAMNKIFWKDDGQICVISSQKKYSERPRTEITIKTL